MSISSMTVSASSRINRNIVECKVKKIVLSTMVCSCINRNIVECKVVSDNPAEVMAFVLIETLWNVKLRTFEYHEVGSQY